MLFLLAVIPSYNFLGSKFDQNSLLIPLWALAIWGLVRSLDGGRLGLAVLCGAAAAGAMLTKYWSLFLLLAMAATLLCDPRRAAYFRSPAPYAAAAVFLILTVPHLVSLIQNRFPPLQWVGARRAAHSAAFFWRAFGNFTLGTVTYASVALLLYVLGTRPSLAAIRDSLWPSVRLRRRAVILFWIPLLAPLPIAIARGMQLVSLWNIPALNLLPVLLLSSDKIVLPRFSVKVMAIVSLVVPLGAILVAPAVPFYRIPSRGGELWPVCRSCWQRRGGAMARNHIGAARILAGPFGLVASASAYMPERPVVYSDFSRYLSPWITQDRIAREGMAIVTPADYPHWVREARKNAGGAEFKEVA